MGSKERHWWLQPSGCPASSKVVLCLSEPPSLHVQRGSEHLPATYSPGPFMDKANVPKQVSALSDCALGFSSGPEKAQLPPDIAIWPADRVTSVKLGCLGKCHWRNEFRKAGYECCHRDGKGLRKPEQRRCLNGLHPPPPAGRGLLPHLLRIHCSSGPRRLRSDQEMDTQGCGGWGRGGNK